MKYDKIEQAARDFYWKRYPNTLIAESSRPDMVIGFVEAVEWYKRQEETFLLRLIDLVWNTVTESVEVPSTQWAKILIEKARNPQL